MMTSRAADECRETLRECLTSGTFSWSSEGYLQALIKALLLFSKDRTNLTEDEIIEEVIKIYFGPRV